MLVNCKLKIYDVLRKKLNTRLFTTLCTIQYEGEEVRKVFLPKIYAERLENDDDIVGDDKIGLKG